MYNFLQSISKKRSYQDKRDNGENWALIEKNLPTPGSLLDVACDAGYYSIRAAESGHFVIGFDILSASIKKAAIKAEQRGLKRAAFLEYKLTPESISVLPKFDTVLCLSVFHHFHRKYGEQKAIQMVRDLYALTNKKLFLQIPSGIDKYDNEFSVDFKGSKESIMGYIRGIFSGISGCEVEYIGKKIEKPPGEKYRYLFVIKRCD